MSTRPFRVLFVLNSSSGGASQGIYEFLESVDRKQIKAYLVFPNQPRQELVANLDKVAAGWKRIDSSWWNTNTGLPRASRFLLNLKVKLRTIFGILPIIQLVNLINKWDIDIVYTGTSLNREGALAARYLKKPHIWHIKETFGPQGRVQYPLPEPKLSKYFLKQSNCVIVMTDYIRSHFDPSVRNDPKIQVVYDGIRAQIFSRKGCGNDLRTKLGLKKEDILIAMVASLSSTWKKHHLFIEMAQRLKQQNIQAKYVLFGPIPQKHQNPLYNKPWQYYQQLLAMLEKSMVGEDFAWAGFHNNIPELMDAIDILVHPCDIEPFGRIAIEAQAAGTVVVGPSMGGISESVLDTQTGFLVAPNDPTSLAHRVKILINDSDLRNKMGQTARDHVTTNFSQQNHNSKILDIFDAIINKR